MNILVTGGAGFIGSFLVDRLVSEGHKVRIFDNLEPQVHLGKKPSYLNPDAEFIRADICNKEALDKALKSIHIVFHEAAMVGVGQSMYEVIKYTRVNELGTATLLDLIVNHHRDHIQKIIVAGSMSEYGEGLNNCKKCGEIKPSLRDESEINKKQWELKCPKCNKFLIPIPTNENVLLNCNSIYAINKRVQEEMVLITGKAFGIPAVALRYFNVYGPRQSLSNPYTGVAAIFISRIKAGKPPVIFEDGLQSRDFVSVHDIVAANIAVMKNSRADYQVFNVGSGKKITIVDLAKLLIKIFGRNLTPEITNQFRTGDIRHCFADITKIKKSLCWKPEVKFDEGIKELIEWCGKEESKDMFNQAEKILRGKGVIR
ncbi:NAD-dependent epimerase/dehydratase family protein [Candidatus Gottesmanbacteria bacterium]|nr:NAD-dependent epimerase/dehydratase family protein [Candidatus Gottesmanbacteria bacterium]